MKRTLALAALPLLLTACGEDESEPATKASATPEVRTFAVTGVVSLIGPIDRSSKTDCFGVDGYDDMHLGTQVVVRDGGGKSVGLGSITSTASGIDPDYECDLSFTVEDVPGGLGIYSVEVASRGEVPFKEEDAEGLSISLS